MSRKQDINADRKTIAVPLPVYRRIKKLADRKGMKLREFPGLLLDAYESMTAEQRANVAIAHEREQH